MTPLERLEWLSGVAADRSLPQSAVAVAVGLVEYVSQKSGLARPGNDALAEALDLNRATVIRCLGALQKAGHLEKFRGGGRGYATEWRLINSRAAATLRNRRTTATLSPQSDGLSEPENDEAETEGNSRSTATLSASDRSESAKPSQKQSQKQSHCCDTNRGTGDLIPPLLVPPTNEPAKVDAPEGVTEATWADWLKHRKQKRQSLTPIAEKRQRALLARVLAGGGSPEAVVRASLESGWTGLFERSGFPETTRNGHGRNPRRDRDSTAEILADALRDAGIEAEAGHGTTVDQDGRPVR